MSIWTTSAYVIPFNELNVFASTDVYAESAETKAFSSAGAIDTSTQMVESADTVAAASISAIDSYKVNWIGSVISPVPVIDGTIQQDTLIVGSVQPLMPVINATLLASFIGVCQPFVAEVNGLMTAGNISEGNCISPLPIVSGMIGYSSGVQAALPIVAGEGLVGQIGQANVTVELPDVFGALTQTVTQVGDIVAPNHSVSGFIIPGGLAEGNINGVRGTVGGTLVSGFIIEGDIRLPFPEITATLISGAKVEVSITLPMPIVSGTLFNTPITFTTWAMNTRNNRVTNYTQFPFISLGSFNNSPMGAALDGIYLLNGDDDNGSPISSTLKFGMADFHNELVGAVDVYIGGYIPSDMDIGLLEDGQGVEYHYPLIARSRHVRGNRAKIGKGLRSQYRQFSINNVNGNAFTLDNFSLSTKDFKGA